MTGYAASFSMNRRATSHRLPSLPALRRFARQAAHAIRVDTYLRFAEAVGRVNIAESDTSQGFRADGSR
jgi:hypothetical protein